MATKRKDKSNKRSYNFLYMNMLLHAVERRMLESRVRENLMHGLMRGG